MYTVFCSGSIKKENSPDRLYWTDAERNDVARAAMPHVIKFLNPDDPLDGMGNAIALAGRDMHQIELANFVIVDARQTRGVGVGTEMVIAKVFEKPLILVIPKGSHYRKNSLKFRGGEVKDYIHPHLFTFSDVIVESFSEAGEWIKGQIELSHPVYKTLDIIFEAIERYSTDLLPHDQVMLGILQP